jgi:RHS repeat-associated protein
MLTKTDPMGYVTTYTYDSQQRLTNATNQGGTKSISYGTGNIVTVTERDGGIWTYKYASAITRPLEVTAPNNAKTISNYDANGNLISRKDPNGHITTYTYDGNGNMLTMTDPLNHTTTYTYNQWGQVTSVTDPDGNVTSNTYDANGNLISITDPSGAIAHYQYDSRGNITAITDAAGRTTTMTYDQYGNLASLTDPSGSVSLFDYDIYGNITGQTDALGNTTLFEYDSVNRLTKVTDPQGNDTAYAYDANGNRTSMTDAKGNVTFYAYNHENQIIEVIDALGNPTTYTYGGTGCQSCGGGTDKLTSVTDANNHTIGYEYDLLGRITEMTDQLGYTETYTYDLNNNLTSVTDRKGQTTTYTYDALNRMTSATYADGSYTNYAYDSTGKVITITDSISGTISYTYSTANSGMPVGKVINETTPLGSISYTYDSIGRRTSMTVDGQPTVNYAYDANSRLTDVIASGAWQSLSFAFAYDALGRRTSTTLPNGLTTNYTYDNVGRLLNLEHLNPAQQILESLTYAYDPNGNRTSMDRTSVNLPKPATAFNITYNQANQMLTFDADAITYDENGNMTSFINNCGITNYTWDARNRLVGISGFSLTSASTCSPVVASFAYDALGRRIEKMVNGRTIQYLYDGKDIVQEIENSTPSVNYIRTLNIDEPLARITADGTVRYYQTDALGSVIALTDDAGVVRTTYSYDPFGNVTISGEASDNTFQYTGRENDGTGLYYYRARYYSPELQRFISEDPIGLKSGDVNFYVMVGNNPVNKIDPQGLSGTSGDWRSYPPGYPPGPKCDAYKQCCKSFLYNACMKGGNGGWSNCVRKCLLDRWHNCKYDHGFWNDHYDCWFNVCKKQ